jgi:FKBP-type peptidyl-prolyl cis-trans isomerase FkpA
LAESTVDTVLETERRERVPGILFSGQDMKKIILALVIAVSVIFVSCQANDKKTAAKTAGATANPSYAFGVAVGNSLKDTSVAIDYNQFLKGVKDVMDKNAPSITLEEAGKVIQASIEAATAKKGEENLAKEKDFLDKNGKKPGVKTTASGLQYEMIKEGTGATPKATDTVKVNYVGTLLDGTKFDSSIDRGQPAEFPLNGVIPGWTEGIQLMKVGGKARFYIPSKLAYGPNGAGGKIAPNSTLIFDVDLLDAKPAAAPAAPAKK